MTRQQRATDELHGATEVLDAIAALVAEGQRAFDASADRRAHLSYLWIVVGSRLKNHCAVLDIPRATGEFAKAIALRQKLAYARPSKRDDELVWTTSLQDAPRLARDVAETAAAMEQR